MSVSPVTNGTDQSRVRVCRSATVLLARDGVFFPRDGTAPIARVSFSTGLLLAELARDEPVEPRSFFAALGAANGVKPFSYHVALKVLRERDVVRSDPANFAHFATSPPSRPAVDPAAPDLHGGMGFVVGAARLLRVVPGGFEALDSEGAPLFRLDPVELNAISSITFLEDLESAYRWHREQAGDSALGEEAFARLVREMLALGVLVDAADRDVKDKDWAIAQRAWERAVASRTVLRGIFEDELRSARRTDDSVGRRRVPVVPIHNQFTTPLSLGMIMAHAQQVDEGRLLDDYFFLPASQYDEDQHSEVVEDGAMFLYSNYVWSHASNLEVSERVKELNPRVINVHGGPDTPKYDGDVEAYFEANPFIDVVVHGEGEITFVEMMQRLALPLREGSRDLSCLDGVAGLSYRGPDGVVRNGPRDRMTDINVVPSPYLSGIFEVEASGPGEVEGIIESAMIETNRGCPYSCTFCDWGSSTAARIRKFDIERVFAEIEWIGKNRIRKVFICDANFGIFERDVEIAQKIADTHRRYGFPQSLSTNYAKNTVKHLQKIVQIMAEAGIVTEGLLSLQSMDEDTLKTIRRSNIKVEKYDALAAEFREAELPLWVDLMIGLPGSTTSSLREDFQQCIDREVNAKVFQTELLINSPMNHPEYRAENKIVTERVDGAPAERVPTRGSAGSGRALVVSSASFTRADYNEMLQDRAVFRLVENFAVLRLTARYLRQAVGIREADLIKVLRTVAHEEADDWPFISIAMRAVPEHMVPPVSWVPFIEEIRRFAVERLGAVPTSGFDTVMQVQLAVLPAPGREFPQQMEIAHDVGAWYSDVLRSKDSGNRTTWTDHVAPLETYPPTTFRVDDPERLCDEGMGFSLDIDPYATWELASPVSRVLADHHVVLERA